MANLKVLDLNTLSSYLYEALQAFLLVPTFTLQSPLYFSIISKELLSSCPSTQLCWTPGNVAVAQIGDSM